MKVYVLYHATNPFHVIAVFEKNGSAEHHRNYLMTQTGDKEYDYSIAPLTVQKDAH